MSSQNLNQLISRVASSLSIEKRKIDDSVQHPNANAQNSIEQPSQEVAEKISSAQHHLAQRFRPDNPNSPLYSGVKFEELNLKPELLQAVYNMGFTSPSKIQKEALPILLKNPPTNLVAQSQSGTGKTAAFSIAMLSRIDPSKLYPQALCLSPTYELAVQTGECVARLGKFLPQIKIRLAVKGENLPGNTKLQDHILIGTPGKILDWIIKFKFFDPKKITVFVLDEADIMIDLQGFQDQSMRIQHQLSYDCQTLFFSATYNEGVREFAEAIVLDPTKIFLPREKESLVNIKQYYAWCRSKEEKYQAITNIYGFISIGQAMIFCRTKATATWLAEIMTKDGHSVGILSGDLEVKDRLAVLDRFRDGFEKVLITTNVLARGIDIAQVTIVINFDMPVDLNNQADYETYLHRIGRTGRFEKAGIAINLVDSEHEYEVCQDIAKFYNREIRHLNIDDPEEIEKIGS